MVTSWVIAPRRERMVEMTWPTSPKILIANTIPKCREALKMVRDQEIVGVDVESYGVNPKKEHAKGKGKALCFQLSIESGEAIFVPLWTVSRINANGTWDVNPKGNEGLIDVFAEWFEDKAPTKVLHNGKYDRHILANHGVMMNGFLGDTLVMDYLYANGEMLHGLKECMRRYFGEKGALDYNDVFKERQELKKPRLNKETMKIETHGKKMFLPSLLEVVRTQKGVNKLIDYSVKDPLFTVKLYRHLAAKMKEMPWVKQDEKVLNYFDYYEMVARPYGDVLFDMEREGCPIDMVHLGDVSTRLDEDIATLEREFLHECVSRGAKPSLMEKFNIESSPQVVELLFEDLGMKCEKLTPKGQKSAGKGALEAIVAKRDRSRRAAKNAELVDILLKHRSRTTLRKMFVRPLVKFAPEYGGRVHSNFKQTGTETGRLSSATPNLENIPTGKKDDEYQLRKAFTAPPGYTVCDIDLKQIEVRLTAHFTKEKSLIELLVNGWDQHLIAMCILFPQVKEWRGDRAPLGDDSPEGAALHKEAKELFGAAQWSEWRRRAKILNFGIIYGMGPQGFVNQVGGGATVEDGKLTIARYFQGFPALQRGIRRIHKKCHQFGYVKTLLKRYCMIPEIHSSDNGQRAQAERQSFNYVIQGSAADMIMLGMLLCWLDPRLRKWKVKCVNQIHDELVFLIKNEYVERAKPIIEEYVSHPYRHTERVLGFKMNDLIVDTPADLGLGPNWMEAKK